MTKLQDFLNSPVNVTAPSLRERQAGDLFGIEVECEGKNVGIVGPEILEMWAPHRDGSLREWQGYPPCEWVFNGPANYKRSVERVNALFDYFEKNKAKLHLSNRTSIHIHFNMGDKTTYQLINTYILFTILEDLLDAYCGEERNGNLFCLSSRHAEGQLRWVEEAIFKNYRFKYNDNWRYCSLNLASLNKFGTIEFRGMRGLDKREDLLAWLSIVNELVNYSCYTMKNPVDLLESISVKRPIGFIKEIFSRENFFHLTRGIDEDQIDNSVYEGLRLVQMLVYKIGTEFDQVRLRGKDFWAGFQEDAEPVKDIDPKEVIAGKNKNPFGGEPGLAFGNQRIYVRPRGARVGHAEPEDGVFRAAWGEALRAPEPAGMRWRAAVQEPLPVGWGEVRENPVAEQPVPPAPQPNVRWDEARDAWVGDNPAPQPMPPQPAQPDPEWVQAQPDPEWVRQAIADEKRRLAARVAEGAKPKVRKPDRNIPDFGDDAEF